MNPPNPPIFVVAEDASVDWYSEVDEQFLAPTGHMETPDIEDGTYLAYDSTGRLLKLDVAQRRVRKKFLRWHYTEWQVWVTVQAAELEPTHADELHDHLANYLSWASPDSKQQLKEYSLEELVEKLTQSNSSAWVGSGHN